MRKVKMIVYDVDSFKEEIIEDPTMIPRVGDHIYTGKLNVLGKVMSIHYDYSKQTELKINMQVSGL